MAPESTEDGRGADVVAMGRALRAIRLSRKYPLRRVAEETGLSRSFLALLESGRTDITISRLMRLVRFYSIRLTDLVVPDGEPDRVVVRRGEQREVRSPAEGIELFLLAPDSNRRMNPVLALFHPGGESAEYAQHEGEEFLHVLDGVLEILIEGHEPLRLGGGDSAYFFATQPHAYRNPGQQPARVVTVTTPPNL